MASTAASSHPGTAHHHVSSADIAAHLPVADDATPYTMIHRVPLLKDCFPKYMVAIQGKGGLLAALEAEGGLRSVQVVGSASGDAAVVTIVWKNYKACHKFVTSAAHDAIDMAPVAALVDAAKADPATGMTVGALSLAKSYTD